MEAGDFTKPGPLKPPIISDAGEKAPFKLSITNKTPKPIYVTVEVGNSCEPRVRARGHARGKTTQRSELRARASALGKQTRARARVETAKKTSLAPFEF